MIWENQSYIKNEENAGLSRGVSGFPEHLVVLVSKEMEEFCLSGVWGDGGHTWDAIISIGKDCKVILN